MVGNAHPPLLGRQAGHAFEPFDPGDAERLGVGHDVGLGHRHEVTGAEITPDPDLMIDRPLQGRAVTAGPHRLFLVGEPHLFRDHSGRTRGGTHLVTSELTNLARTCGVRWSGGGRSAPGFARLFSTAASRIAPSTAASMLHGPKNA